MLVHTDAYIAQCLQLEILTTKPLYKYPLRKGNLAAVLKAYAISTRKPYDFNLYHVKQMPDEAYYLTEAGFTWLLDVFTHHSFAYLRRIFKFVFAKATKEDVSNTDYEGYNNFKGITGDKPKEGTKRGALLVRKVGRVERVFTFTTLREARKELMNLLRFYPAEQFTLYRLHKYGHRIEVPLILEPSNRGAHLRK